MQQIKKENRSVSLSVVLILLAIALVVAGVIGWHWDSWLQQTVVWQRLLNRSLSALMQDVADHRTEAGWMLILVSFLYGLLHAMGPGHGKVIITAYIATHPTHLKRSVFLALLASLLQGLVAIVLTFSVLYLLQLSTRQVHLGGVWLEKLSYGVIALFGMMLLFKSVKRLLKSPSKKTEEKAITPTLQPIQSIIKPLKIQSISAMPTHQHSAECGCGHQHIITSDTLQKEWKSQLMVVFAMGFRPCSGALLMLILSYVMGIFYWGMLAAMAMAMGTALTIASIAMMIYFMRQLAVKALQFKRIRLLEYGVLYLQLIAGILLILMGFILYQSLDVSTSTSVNPLLR